MIPVYFIGYIPRIEAAVKEEAIHLDLKKFPFLHRGAFMYQLILHHNYRLGGQAVDLSGANQHGFVTGAGFEPDGIALNSGALVFKQSSARIRVPKRGIWDSLFALKIEIWVRAEAFGARRNLVEGDNSFAFAIDKHGFLWGTFHAPQIPGGALVWHGANSQINSPNGVPQKVPLNAWVKLSFVHDGYASLRLYIDDILVAANYSLISGIPPVGNAGVHIGNWTLSDQYTFNGQIDEVKIYRYDPDEAYVQFFCRDLNTKSAPCWQNLFQELVKLHEHGSTTEQFAAFIKCIAYLQTEIIRAIRAKGEMVIKENERLTAKYRELWCKGEIDGPEMQAWQEEWLSWLKGGDRHG
jgi:hypothetical protein